MTSLHGSYYLIKSRLNGLALDIEGQGGSGSRVITWDVHGGDNQMWYYDFATSTIRSKLNNCALTIENNLLIVKDVEPDNRNQMWLVSGQYVRNGTDNKVLGIIGGNAEKGAQIGSYEQDVETEGNSQKWDFEVRGGPAPTIASSLYYEGYRREFYIVSQMHGKVLDISEQKVEPGAKIIMWDKLVPSKPNQLWYLDSKGIIRSALNDLTISNEGKASPLVTAVPSQDPRSQWHFQGNKIANKVGEFMDISAENDSNGAEVISYDSHDKSNQKWRQEED